MRFSKFLEEARRNPDINKKEHILEILSKYKNEKNIYVHFSIFNKIGINPRFDFPIFAGIYAYPINAVLDAIHSEQELFAIDRPYMFIIRAKNILVIKNYSNLDLQKDLKYLIQHFKKTYKISDEKINESLKWANEIEPRTDNSINAQKTKHFSVFHYFIWYIFIKVLKIDFSSFSWKYNKLLRNIGYKCILDDVGFIDGTDAPKQIICLSKKDFDIVSFYNVLYSYSSEQKHKTLVTENNYLEIFEQMDKDQQLEFLETCFSFKNTYEFNGVLYHLKLDNSINNCLLRNTKFGISAALFFINFITKNDLTIPVIRNMLFNLISIVLQENKILDKQSKKFVVEFISYSFDDQMKNDIKGINF